MAEDLKITVSVEGADESVSELERLKQALEKAQGTVERYQKVLARHPNLDTKESQLAAKRLDGAMERLEKRTSDFQKALSSVSAKDLQKEIGDIDFEKIDFQKIMPDTKLISESVKGIGDEAVDTKIYQQLGDDMNRSFTVVDGTLTKVQTKFKQVEQEAQNVSNSLGKIGDVAPAASFVNETVKMVNGQKQVIQTFREVRDDGVQTYTVINDEVQKVQFKEIPRKAEEAAQEANSALKNVGNSIGQIGEIAPNAELVSSTMRVVDGQEQLIEKFREVNEQGTTTYSTINGEVQKIDFKPIQQGAQETKQQLDDVGEAKIDAAIPKTAKLKSATVQVVNGAEKLVEVYEDVGKDGAIRFTKVNGELKKVNVSTKNNAKSMKDFDKSTKGATKSSRGLLQTFKRVLLYRIIRSAIQAMEDFAKEGIKAFAEIDKGANAAMSEIKSSISVMQASFGALIAPILEAVAPLFRAIAVNIANVANEVSRLIAQMKGLSTYTKINTQYMEKYGEETEKAAKASQNFAFDTFTTLSGGGEGEGSGEEKKEGASATLEEVTIDESAAADVSNIAQLFMGVYEVINQIIGAVMYLSPLFAELGNAILPMFTAVIPIVEQLVAILVTGLAAAIPPITNLILELQPFMLTLLETVGQFISVLAELTGKLLEALSPAIAVVLQGIQSFLEMGLNVLITILGRVTEDLKKFTDGLDGTEDALDILLGICETVLGSLTSLLEENKDKIIATIKNAITKLSDILKELIPRAATFVVDLFGVIISAIVEVLPTLVSIVAEVIPTILTAITELAPTLIKGFCDVILGLVRVVKENLPQFVTLATQIITTLLNALVEMLPKILESGKEILNTLIEGIVELLPVLVDSAIEIIQTLCNTLLTEDNITKIIDSAVEIFLTLVNGLIDMLPVLIDGAFQIIDALVTALVEEDNLSKIIDSAVELLDKLCTGLIDALPRLIDAAMEIIMKLVETLSNPENMNKLVTTAVNLVLELAKGLIKAIPDLLKGAAQLIESLSNAILEIDWIALGKDVLNSIIEGLNSIVPGLGDIFLPLVDILDLIGAIFTGDWSTALKAFGNLFVDIGNGIITGFEWIVNFFIRGVNDITKGLSSLWTWIGIPAIPAIPEVKFDRIPRFKSGGVAERGQLFIAGEAGAEAVWDNNNGSSSILTISQFRQATIEAIIATDIPALIANAGHSEIYMDSEKVGESVGQTKSLRRQLNRTNAGLNLR